MKLRYKSLILFGVSLTAVIGLMCLAIRIISVRSFDQMEQRGALRAVNRSRNLVQHELEDLSHSVRGYASQEQLASAVDRADSASIQRNFSADVFESQGWSFNLVLRNDGTVLDAREFVDRMTPLRGLAAGPLAELKKLVDGRDLAATRSETQFIGRIEGQPCLIAFAPTMSGENQPKQTGLLIAVIRLDTPEMDRIAAMADAPVKFLSPNHAEIIEQATPIGNERVVSTFLAKTNEGKQGAFAVLRDSDGKTVGILQVALDTGVREESVFFTRVLIAIVLVLAGFLCVLIDRIVLRPQIVRLAQLSATLKEVQRSGNLSARLPVANKDEISLLAREANRMLSSIESSQRTLERMNAEMQQRVAERTTALAEANAALEADIANRITAEDERTRLREQLLQAHKMEAVGTLAGGIAHDFNNILTGILGHAQLIEAELPPNSQVRSNLNHVIDAAERAAALVHQILAFSRQTPGERNPIAVSHVAREALSLLRAALPSGIEIKCQIETDADTINADPTQLHQVFMNLGANAGHAMGSRGGELEVKIHRIKRPPGAGLGSSSGLLVEYVCISVKDSGCGMSPEVMDRIFDPFFSTKPVNEGTGLGLAVVHGIVTDHGGMIEVESTPGVGTCFRICLPPANVPVPEKTRDTATSLHGNERILLVDDEAIVLSVARQTLQRLGYRVTAARDGQEGLDLFKRTPRDFDLVITDQTMPFLSGLQLTEAIKEVRPHIPVILATGYSPDIVGQEASSLGLEGIIGKPINFAELTLLMRNALDRDKADLASHSPFNNTTGW